MLWEESLYRVISPQWYLQAFWWFINAIIGQKTYSFVQNDAEELL